MSFSPKFEVAFTMAPPVDPQFDEALAAIPHRPIVRLSYTSGASEWLDWFEQTAKVLTTYITSVLERWLVSDQESWRAWRSPAEATRDIADLLHSEAYRLGVSGEVDFEVIVTPDLIDFDVVPATPIRDLLMAEAIRREHEAGQAR